MILGTLTWAIGKRRAVLVDAGLVAVWILMGSALLGLLAVSAARQQ
jgi:hypothetical protein